MSNPRLFHIVGAIAQLVEQRTENPCVPRSIRGGTTENQAVITEVITAFILSTKKKAPNLNDIYITLIIIHPEDC